MSTPLGSSQWMYASGAEVVQQSLKFNDDETQYLSWTPTSAGNRKTWTWSGWVKRGNLGNFQSLFAATTELASGNSDSYIALYNDQLLVANYTYPSGTNWSLTTNAVFRDISAWYAVQVVVDTTQATASDRIKLYVNGEQITSFASSTYPSQNYEGFVNSTYTHKIGNAYIASSTYGFDGYLSNIHFIDGQALDPTSFGQFTNGYWEKKDYAGSYGTNGFHLTFEDDVVSEGFNAVTWRGDGNNTASISGLGFSPDLLWIKNRTDASNQNLMDSVRGASVRLLPSATLAEVSSFLGSFDGDGFTFSGGNDNDVNQAGDSYVAWAWDAGSGSPVSNTDGSITSTVKANPDYGFSIVSYTGNATSGATVGHGIATPEMIIVKDRDAAQSWRVYHPDVGATKTLSLNETSAAFSDSSIWNNTAPTSSVFSLGNGGSTNGSGRNYIAYCFNSVAGYSKISSFTGTGAAGNAVTCGFRPAFVMIKRSNNTGNWVIWDTTRLPQSGTIQGSYLSANLSDAEESPSGSNDIEFTDTGFTLQDSGIYSNSSGDTFIYMAFADTREAAFWKDVSGQGNHWTPNNLDYRDSLPDSPANNFAVLNAVDKDSVTTLSEGSLKATSYNAGGAATIMPETGKYYWEVFLNDPYGGIYWGTHGITPSTGAYSSYLVGTGVYALATTGGGLYVNGSLVTAHTTWANGDVIGLAFDADAMTLDVYRNGTQLGSSLSVSSGYYRPSYLLNGTSGDTATVTYNFGQDSTFAGAKPMGAFTDDNGIGNFQYAPPTGYLALCTANLPTPTIIDASTAFNTVLYTGNSSTNAITGVGFQPDFLWLKARSNSGYDHVLQNVITGSTNQLYTNSTSAEVSDTDAITSFDTDGFTSGADITTNNSGVTYAAWNWKAGGTAVSNTAGTITSQVSANVDAGFSIVSYTANNVAGATVGHGLGQEPSLIIQKDRDSTEQWLVYHKSLGATKYLLLNSTIAAPTSASAWNNTAPTSSVYSLGAGYFSGNDHIAYCFADVDGFSKAGSFTGNGSSDGTFVYTGFRPAWVMTKRTNTTGEWWISDISRDPYNLATSFLWAQNSGAEAASSSYGYDILSNGFKLRTTYADRNASGSTFIYLAFAEHPFKHSNAR